GQAFYIGNVSPDNVASQRLMRKLGGAPIGAVPFPGASEEELRIFDSSSREYDRELYAALAKEFSTTERALKSHVLSLRIPASGEDAGGSGIASAKTGRTEARCARPKAKRAGTRCAAEGAGRPFPPLLPGRGRLAAL